MALDWDECGVRQQCQRDVDGRAWRWRARSPGQMAAGDIGGPAWRGSARRLGSPRAGQTPAAPSGRRWQDTQSRQGAAELVLPGPASGKMQCETARRAGEPSGHGEEPPPEGLGGCHRLAEADARRPAGQQLCWLSRKMGNFCGTRTTPCRVIFDHGV